MSPKTFIALAVATVVAVAAATVAIQNRGTAPVAGIGERVFPGLIDHVNEVASMIVDYGQGRLTLEHGKSGWTVKENDDYPARAVKVRQVILGIAELKLLEPKTTKKENFSKLDLDDPAAKGARSKRVQLFDRERKLAADIVIGKRRLALPGSTQGGIYLRRPDETQTWLAAGGPEVSDERRDWLERKIIDIDGKRVKRVVIRHPDGEMVSVTKASPEAVAFTLDNVPADKKVTGPAGVNYVGGALHNLQLDDVKKLTESFDASATVTAEITTFDGIVVNVLVTERGGKKWMRLDASAAPGAPSRKEGPTALEEAKEITARANGWTYQISEYAASTLTKRMQNLVEDKKAKS
ncbi:MAG TPA: DUF4340 domain-containing protein [Rhodospirillales bacterium]